MTKTIEFTIPELLKQLDAGLIPKTAKVRVVLEEPPVQKEPPENSDLSLFRQWEEADKQATEEQRSENKRIYAEIEANGIPRLCTS